MATFTTVFPSPGSIHHSYFTVRLNGTPWFSACFPARAAAQGSATPSPSFFELLKEAVVLPARNRRLFATVFALLVASTALLLLADDLAVQPRVDQVGLDIWALNANRTDATSGPDDHRDELTRAFLDDSLKLVVAGAAYLTLAATVGAAVQIVALFAAVATYSGDDGALTFGALLGRAKAQLRGPMMTLAMVYAMEAAYVAVMAAAAAFLVISSLKNRIGLGLLLLGTLFLLAASLLLVYLTFLCALSVVVAVAETRRRGAAAVGRAWRLLRGRWRRAALLVAVNAALSAGISRVHALARARAHSSSAEGLLLVLLYTVLTAAVELFAVCAITAFYCECKESDEASTAEFVKLATEELIGA